MNFKHLSPFVEEKVEEGTYKFKLHKNSPWFIFDKDYAEVLYSLEMIYVPYQGLVVKNNGVRLSDAILEITSKNQRALHLKNNFTDYRKINLVKKTVAFVEKYSKFKHPIDHFKGCVKHNAKVTIKTRKQRIRSAEYNFPKTNQRYFKTNSIKRNWRDPSFRTHTFKTHQYFIFDKDMSGRLEGIFRTKRKARDRITDIIKIGFAFEGKRWGAGYFFGNKNTEEQAVIKAIRWRLNKMKSVGLEFTDSSIKWPDDIKKMEEEELTQFLLSIKKYEFRNNPLYTGDTQTLKSVLTLPYPLKNK